ncbi:hypothetical protein ACQ4M4_05825 [Leptolyngbya sp. AN02str]
MSGHSYLTIARLGAIASLHAPGSATPQMRQHKLRHKSSSHS